MNTTPIPMTPTPFLKAFPKLAATIDDERPLISAALLDIRITNIESETVAADVLTEHSFEILRSPRQRDYLDNALTKHMGHPCMLLFNLKPEVTEEFTLQPPPKPKRAANTLTYSERANLEHWMQLPENADYVAKESDALAAGKATGDLKMDITASNIASMRKILGIEKLKPTPPAPPPNIDLIALHAQVQQHHAQLDPIAGVNIAEVLSNLRNSLAELKTRIDALESAHN